MGSYLILCRSISLYHQQTLPPIPPFPRVFLLYGECLLFFLTPFLVELLTSSEVGPCEGQCVLREPQPSLELAPNSRKPEAVGEKCGRLHGVWS